MSARPTPDQSVKDALCDAETLLVSTERLACGMTAWAAEAHGKNAQLRVMWGLPDAAYDQAKAAAHFAFKAVPGLRPDSTGGAE